MKCPIASVLRKLAQNTKSQRNFQRSFEKLAFLGHLSTHGPVALVRKMHHQQNIGDWTNVIERISVDLAQAFNLPYLAQSLADDMVIMGDMKVPSLILEDTLRTGAGIKDAAVVGVEAIGGDDIVCVALV